MRDPADEWAKGVLWGFIGASALWSLFLLGVVVMMWR